MTPTLFWGTFLKLLWLSLCWVIFFAVFEQTLWILCMCWTLLSPTASDCYLNTNNLDAHRFHLNCDASGDICLKNFPLAAYVPLLALWRWGVIVSGFFPLSLQFRKGWKILFQKSLKDFLSALGNFPSSPRLCLALSCNNVPLGTQGTWEAKHVLVLVVNHRGCWYGVSLWGQQQWSKLVFNRSDAGCES